MVDDGCWRADTWFEELAPYEKLMFLYFVTHPAQTPCGAFECSVRTMIHDTGIPEKQANEIVKKLCKPAEIDGKPRVYWWPDLKVVFLSNWFQHQRWNVSFEQGATKSAVKFPTVVQAIIFARYPQLRPTICGTPPSETEDTLCTQSIQSGGYLYTKTPHQDRTGQDSTDKEFILSQSETIERAPAQPIQDAPEPGFDNGQSVVGASHTKKRFVPPTVVQAEAYMVSRGAPGLGQGFCDYWESFGWSRGNRKMVDWQASCRTWIANSAKFSRNGHSNGHGHAPALDLKPAGMTQAEFDAAIAERNARRAGLRSNP
jgi:hypothetical protein